VTIRQYAGFSTAEDSNASNRRNLAADSKGLSIAFRSRAHRGYDSDHPRVTGDVGMAGVAIDSIYDMRTLFAASRYRCRNLDDHERAVLPCSRSTSSRARNRVSRTEKRFRHDSKRHSQGFMVRNTYIYPPVPSMRIVSDIFGYTSQHMPKFNSISISGYHMQEAGRDAGSGTRLHVADGVEYVRAGIEDRARHRPASRGAAVVLLGDPA